MNDNYLAYKGYYLQQGHIADVFFLLYICDKYRHLL